MEYRNLGKSGLKISVLGLGANNFGWWIDEPASAAVINHALDIGMNYIDTADMYDTGKSEEFIGRILKGRRKDVLLATKFAMPMAEGINDRGGSRWYIIRALEASLKRLQTDYVDLYQMHQPDPTTPIEESLRALDELVKSGKVRYIGCSNFAAWQLSDALWTSRVNNLHSFVTVQPRYNLFDRHIEPELVPCCKAHGIGVIPWGPLSGGFLTGKYRHGEQPSAPPPGFRQAKAFLYLYSPVMTDANWERLGKLETFAKNRGHKVAALSIAWLLSHPWLSTVIAGATKPEQLDANLIGAGWKLTPEEVAQVEQI
ncbi:MAG TPA: aldo/keto reductase [Thermodesulfobacteriota bacterium]|nr:aldo/keto reductase [Thermodesulfobacteriota bacterium]